jgi:hypothetical protein
MFTSNRDILRRLDNLKEQLKATEKEINLRMQEARGDNDGYVITKNDNGKYSLVAKEFYLKQLVKSANEQLRASSCINCKEKE